MTYSNHVQAGELRHIPFIRQRIRRGKPILGSNRRLKYILFAKHSLLDSADSGSFQMFLSHDEPPQRLGGDEIRRSLSQLYALDLQVGYQPNSNAALPQKATDGTAGRPMAVPNCRQTRLHLKVVSRTLEYKHTLCYSMNDSCG